MSTLKHALLIATLLYLQTVHAQSAYPSRPIRVVIPFAAGGSPDVIARGLASQLDGQLGKNVIIDNRAGANGIIGAQIVASAAPDGHTLLHTPPAFVINALVYKQLPYDVLNDFLPVTQIGESGGYFVLVAPTLGVNTIKELVALAKAKPLSYGSPPVGNTLHLATEMFKQRTGAPLLHVPFKGGGEIFNSLMGGEIHVAFVPPPGAMPFVKAGKLRALAVTSDQRFFLDPAIPTLKETGWPIVWEGGSGLLVPAGTPTAVVSKMAQDVETVLGKQEVKSALQQNGVDSAPLKTNEFALSVREISSQWAAVIRSSGAKVD